MELEEEGMTLIDMLNYPVFAGTVWDWVVAVGVAALIVVAVLLLRPLAQRRFAGIAGRTSTRVDDALLHMFGATKLLLVGIFAFSFGAQYLELPPRLEKIVSGAATIAMFLQIGVWLSAGFKYWLGTAQKRALEMHSSAATTLSAMGFVGQLVLWSLIVLITLDNLGVEVTTLIAGLGVGGVAVALAVQNILGDLFASLSIVVDKPFVIGDFIIVDEYLGTVEHIGLKTTRIRSLSGEQLVFSNSDLLGSRVRNYKRMYERRVVFGFGVIYQTTADQLEWIPKEVRRIVEQQPQVRFDRAHFFKFGESSYDFEVVYWVTDPDYNVYMDRQQAINLALVRAFEKAGIAFAYPTRTLYLETPVQVLRTPQHEAAQSDG